MDQPDGAGSARDKAEARWNTVDPEASFVENLSEAVLGSWCARAGLVLARPHSADARFDFLVTEPDPAWVLPIVMKAVAVDGLDVYATQRDIAAVFVWVVLGRADGGVSDREQTSMIVLDPDQAWQLPIAAADPPSQDPPSRHWPSIEALAEQLNDHTAANPQQLRELLRRRGWRSPASES